MMMQELFGSCAKLSMNVGERLDMPEVQPESSAQAVSMITSHSELLTATVLIQHRAVISGALMASPEAAWSDSAPYAQPH